MQEACRRGDLDAVKIMVSTDKKRVTTADPQGVTPLHRASAGNHIEIVEFLIEQAADPNAEDRYGEAPLKKAAYNGHVDSVTLLLQAGADVNHADTQGKMALHHAAEQGKLQSIEVMLDSGAMVNAEVKEYLTPLHMAAAQGHTWACKMLLEHGALIDARGGRNHGTAIHMAAEGGHTQTVSMLIAEGADVNATDRQGRHAGLLSKDKKTKDVFDSAFLRESCYPASCTVEGPGIQPEIIATDKAMFAIQPRQRFGQILRDPDGHIPFSVELQSVKTGVLIPGEVAPSPQHLNSTCYYDASQAGDYVVHVYQESVLIEGKESASRAAIGGSPFPVKVLPGRLDPYTTRGKGQGLTKAPSGQTTSFVVYGRDKFNNWSPGGEVIVLIEPHNRLPVDLQVVDKGNGEYHVSYTAPPESGQVKLSVAVQGGAHIYNSPFTVFVSPGNAVPEQCEVAGRGVVRGGVDMDCTFRIHARDAAGNHLIMGGLKWAVNVIPENVDVDDTGGANLRVEVEIEDAENGVYYVTYHPLVAGAHTVRVMLNNRHVKGSPFKAMVYEAPEWESDEVAQWVESLGFNQYVNNFLNNDIRGFMLPDLNPDALEHEIGIGPRGHQSMVIQGIKKMTANDEVDIEALMHVDDHTLVQLGVTDKKTRDRMMDAVHEEVEFTAKVIEPHGKELLIDRMKSEIFAAGEKITEDLSEAVENHMSTTMQTLLTDMYSSTTKDGFGISRALQVFEAQLKQSVEKIVRQATVKDEDAVNDDADEGGSAASSRPASGR